MAPLELGHQLGQGVAGVQDILHQEHIPAGDVIVKV